MRTLTSSNWSLLLIAAGLATAVTGLGAGPASAASSRCTVLPVRASLASGDPTAVRDEPRAFLAPSAGASVRNVSVSVRRGSTTYATGTISGRLAKGTIAVQLTLSPSTMRAGTYRIVATGQRSGCAKRTSVSRALKLRTPSLPVRAAPLSTLVGDNEGAVRLVLRSVAHSSIASVNASLVNQAGDTVAAVADAAPFNGESIVDLPLASSIPAGKYTLRLTGRTSGSSTTQISEQPITFASGGGSAPVTPPTGSVRQKSVVDWSGGAWKGREVAGFVAPGIGHGEIVCRPDAQWLRFYPADQGREVSMMNWTYRDWGQNQEKALREALHTQYTGPDFQEGLNKFSPTEKIETGQFDGIIADRGPFAALSPSGLAEPTTLKLTWSWDFTQTGKERCHVEAVFTTATTQDTTPLARSAQVVWRGDAGAAGHDSAKVDVPGLGTLSLVCQATPGGTRTLTVDTPSGAAITTRQGSDDSTASQSIGPVVASLPGNGMLSVALDGGKTLLVSSRWKTNDPDLTQNFCKVAAQVTSS